jgi:putative acyl-CoA dehydrogenase
MSDFFQAAPNLGNSFTGNRWLKAYLRHAMPAEIFRSVEAGLTAFGDLCAGPYRDLARQAEAQKPALVSSDPWGRRIDDIVLSPAWRALQDESAREGLVAIPYAREYGEWSRVLQFAKLYLFHPSSAFFSCPLAMTDGAAKLLQTFEAEPIHRQAFAHLTSQDPREFWTSGQWMTERSGGSDVSETATQARMEKGAWRLYGTKYFASATTAEIALALARKDGAPQGSRGLTLFLVHPRDASGAWNGVHVRRLKDKLGTQALPTAELDLEGCRGVQVGAEGGGVKTVATMLNITRLHNAICSLGETTRALEEMRDYSSKRIAFGAALDSHVLHVQTFAREEVTLLAGFLLTMELVHLLGREECGLGNADETAILRLMTPVCKLFTARAAVVSASEVVEGFGGAGYVEDVGIARHLRDAQVFPIWEGATNVLSLDMLRVVQNVSAFAAWASDVEARIARVSAPDLSAHATQLQSGLASLTEGVASMLAASDDEQAASSRELAFALAWTYASALAVSWADRETPGNRASLQPWLSSLIANIGTWHPRDAASIERSRAIWQSDLER